VVSEDKRKKIEHRTYATPGEFKIPGTPDEVIRKTKIAKRAVKEMKQGMNVNLGIGIPSLCVNFIDP
jgi:acyl CoA:acetate/3-ketoacid CoA transferase